MDIVRRSLDEVHTVVDYLEGSIVLVLSLSEKSDA